MRRTQCVANGVYSVDRLRKLARNDKEVIDFPVASGGFGRMEDSSYQLEEACCRKLGGRAVKIARQDPRTNQAANDGSEMVQQVKVHFAIDRKFIVAVQRDEVDTAAADRTNLAHVDSSRMGCLRSIAVRGARCHADVGTAKHCYPS